MEALSKIGKEFRKTGIQDVLHATGYFIQTFLSFKKFPVLEAILYVVRLRNLSFLLTKFHQTDPEVVYLYRIWYMSKWIFSELNTS